MTSDSFVGYLDYPEVHDGVIEWVDEQDEKLIVHVKSIEGQLVVFEFSGVLSVKKNRPIGMLLYSLSEMNEPPPYRRFAFTNWDDEDDAYLEVVARGVSTG